MHNASEDGGQHCNGKSRCSSPLPPGVQGEKGGERVGGCDREGTGVSLNEENHAADGARQPRGSEHPVDPRGGPTRPVQQRYTPPRVPTARARTRPRLRDPDDWHGRASPRQSRKGNCAGRRHPPLPPRRGHTRRCARGTRALMAWQAVPPSTPLTHTGNAEEGDGSSGGSPVRRRRSSFRSKHGESGGTATATGSNPAQTSPPLPPTHRFHPPLPHKNNKRKKETGHRREKGGASHCSAPTAGNGFPRRAAGPTGQAMAVQWWGGGARKARLPRLTTSSAGCAPSQRELENGERRHDRRPRPTEATTVVCLTRKDHASSPPTPLFPHKPAEQHKPTAEPDRHHKCAAPANCAFGGGVPPARARAGHCVQGARLRAVSGGSRRERSGRCAQRTSASSAGRPRANLCVRAGRHREPEGQARRAAWRRGGGGGRGQRWRGRGGCGRLRCTRATASAARGGATGASFWRGRSRATESSAQQRRRGSSSATDNAKRRRAQSFRSSSPCISDGQDGGGPPPWRA